MNMNEINCLNELSRIYTPRESKNHKIKDGVLSVSVQWYISLPTKMNKIPDALVYTLLIPLYKRFH